MNNNELKKEEYLRLGFFKIVWYSITKFEKYPELAALGIKKAIFYFTKLMLIFSVLFAMAYVYNANNSVLEEKNISSKIIKQIINNYGVTDEQKEELIHSFDIRGENKALFILFVSFFISIYISTLLDTLTLSIFGVITCFICRIKITYKALFNMSVFAMTLSIILRIVYMSITLFTDFTIKYFNIMYAAISYIILAAAIFMIKSDVLKQQMQLIDFIEKNKEKMERTMIPEDEEEDNNDDKEEKENDSNEKDKKPEEEQGSNA